MNALAVKHRGKMPVHIQVMYRILSFVFRNLMAIFLLNLLHKILLRSPTTIACLYCSLGNPRNGLRECTIISLPQLQTFFIKNILPEFLTKTLQQPHT